MEKMDGMTMNIEQANVEKLKEVFPEVFADGKVDFDKLQRLLGNYIADDKERYSFSWKGKADSLRLAQKRSTGTLRTCKEESKNWDTTENLYIEGDNLEVLKLLQSAYLNSVKMIYIDPPYNTGNDFVYTDDFADGIAHYKEVTGQATKSNPETAGRYHTNWLNMMYPRLKLARNLLTDDGVIFISIDDNEQANLKKLCDEVFGEDNFLACIVWEKRFTRSNNARLFASLTDYILVYRKSSVVDYLRAPRTEKSDSIYSNPDNDPRGVWTSVSYVNPATKEQRPNLTYPIINPITGQKVIHPTNAWKYEYERHLVHVKEKRLYWGINGENTYPRLKKFLSEVEDGMVPVNLWKRDEVGTTDAASKELSVLMGVKVFDFPKPVELVKFMSQIVASDKDSIILDFFSGSATTAHAVMQLNAEDGGHRKFICVQLPEKTDEHSEAYKAGYKTICEIGKERIRRAGEKIKAESPLTTQDIDTGFKVFKLDSSNLVKWDNTPTTDEEEVKKRIQQSLFYLVDGRSDLDLVYEIMLKYGLPLTLPVGERDFDGVTAYIIDYPDYKVLICLQPNITLSAVEEMEKEDVGTYIFADRCFADANILSNTEEILKKKDKEMRLF